MAAELEHRAFLYSGDDDFLRTAVPFLEEGVAAERAVVVVARAANVALLREAAAGLGSAVEFFESESFYRHPVRTLNQYQHLVVGQAPRRVYALAEPVWTGHEPRGLLEWMRYESLINAVFADSGATALCPYDRDRLPPQIVEQARRTHPDLLVDGVAAPSPHYEEPLRYGAGCDRQRTFDRPRLAEYLPFHTEDLRDVRAFVAERAALFDLDEMTAQNLVTAVNEVAANALQHGVPPMGVWMWESGPEVVCEIGDNGFWQPDALTGFLPPRSALQRGFGLWTVRLLVDLMEVRAGWDGTFVRLRMRR
ncbi:sensor histidine kinase [Actinomadura parmotrematis]|uniref:Sensor histidine kinase n=1 Tax=Actinomadura parmotrematis TaxID=2864039 RepID=A0ABS7FTU1_9ACTN|nr:sensor histidine kinase [Actinomadura parmotrematis]MBW8483830.1 sensor histidine kinase [Actinomadura parmotrematis]